MGNIVQYWTVYDLIIHYVTVPQINYPIYQDLTIYKLFV